jgi:hypothetical protein
MTRQLLGGAAVAALIIVSAAGARANPLNTFSNGDTTTINSGAAASTGDGGDGGNAAGGGANGGDAKGSGSGQPYGENALWTGGGSDPGTAGNGGSGGTAGAGGAGGGTATATSESYNTEQEGVSNQTLNGSVTYNTVSAEWDYGDSSSGSANIGGDAGISGFSNAAGVNMASANTGAQSLNQQAVSLGIVGTVNLNHN